MIPRVTTGQILISTGSQLEWRWVAVTGMVRTVTGGPVVEEVEVVAVRVHEGDEVARQA